MGNCEDVRLVKLTRKRSTSASVIADPETGNSNAATKAKNDATIFISPAILTEPVRQSK